MQKPWYTHSSNAVLKELETNEHGLSKNEAKKRLADNGPNKLPEGKAESYAGIFFRQFKNPLIYVLIGASAIVFALGEIIDAGVIAFVLIFNALVGAIQEGRAQNALRELKKLAETYATVIRAGHTVRIVDNAIVPGDIIIVQSGDTVPADARLLRVYNLRVDEAALTGESLPIEKSVEPLSTSGLAAADQKNMVFKGTLVTSGQALAAVVATGRKTEIGKIAQYIIGIDTEIPLTRDIRTLARVIVGAIAAFSIALFFLGISYGISLREMFTVVVSLAVSIIPEGLPMVVTLVLANGVWRMSKRNALVKRLQAVEALGQTDIIAVDKTGTITRNEMVIREVYIDSKFFTVEGDGYRPTGSLQYEGKYIEPANHPELILAGKIAALSSSAQLLDEDEGRWRIFGDPTEAALTVFGRKTDCIKADIEQEFALVHDIPFDSSTKYHAAIHQEDHHHLISVSGAPEVVLGLCDTIWRKGAAQPLTAREKKTLEDAFLTFSKKGFRVVAGAQRRIAAPLKGVPRIEKLTFTVLYAMSDAIRPEVHRSVQQARDAGIRIVMITGDHQTTAEAIAREVGIFHDGDSVLSGSSIDALPDKELAKRIASCTLFARVTPDHKLRIIRAFKANGATIAMTGDGVNDAPSLIAADLGVSMGKIGTDVTKEASDIILLDDNFGTIIAAVEEGRGIYRTLQKILLYLFSTSIGEALTVVGALLIGLPLPLVAAQIIWMNMVTDTPLVLALAMDPHEKNILTGKMKQMTRFLIDRAMGIRIGLLALPMAIGTLILFSVFLHEDKTKAMTIAFTALVFFQLVNAFNCRSERQSILRMNPVSNHWLLIGIAVSVALQLVAVYTPFMNTVLRTTPLTLSEWLIIIPLTLSVIVVDELRKGMYGIFRH